MRNGDEKREYANGTYLMSRQPWGIFTGGAALCADGVVRKLKRIAITADTFFSIPAAVQVRGKTVAGYVTFKDVNGGTVDWESVVVEFHAYTYRKNHTAIIDKTAS